MTIEKLTRKETEVLNLLVTIGCSAFAKRAIAQKLCISKATLWTHIKNLYGKLGADCMGSMILKAYEYGLISKGIDNVKH